MLSVAESRELRAKMVQVRIRFVKACDKAAAVIDEFMAVWKSADG